MTIYFLMKIIGMYVLYRNEKNLYYTPHFEHGSKRNLIGIEGKMEFLYIVVYIMVVNMKN